MYNTMYSADSMELISIVVYTLSLIHIFVSKFGDPNLAWQRTLDKNIGINLSMFSNRFHVTVDFYHKRTDPLIADIGIPVSMRCV